MHVQPYALKLLVAAGGILGSVTAAGPALALNTVCTPQWSSVAQGQPATATLAGASPPCPASATTVSIGNVGYGPNVGASFATNWGSLAQSGGFPTTSNSSMAIGSGATPSTVANAAYAIRFNRAVANPLLYFGFFDKNTSFTFQDQFLLVSASNAVRSGQSILPTINTADRESDGFVVQVLGSFLAGAPISFTYGNTNVFAQSVIFTAGVASVPAPLPVLGAAMAFQFSRRLRRRLRA